MVEFVLLFFGFLAGVALNHFWRLFLNVKEVDRALLHDFEHYHWAIFLATIYLIYPNEFLIGLAMAFAGDELLQDRPFAYGKKHFIESTIIGLLFIWLFLLVYYFV